MPPSFRINAKTFFLTFPKCSESKEDLHAHIQTFHPKWSITAAEEHKDGTPHLHCVLGFVTRKDIKNQNFFDYNGFHCNIQQARNAADVAHYVVKGGQFCSTGPTPLRATWASALTCETKTEFLEAVRSVSPRDYVLSNERINSYATHIYDTSKLDYAGEWTQFDVPSVLKEWTETEFLNGTF